MSRFFGFKKMYKKQLCTVLETSPTEKNSLTVQINNYVLFNSVRFLHWLRSLSEK